MIDVPPGTRVFGIQLPVQSHSLSAAVEWEHSAGPDAIARIARAADDAGFFYVGVCDHVAIPDERIPTLSSFWADCIATLSWIAPQTTRVRLLSHVYILPYRHPLVAAKQFATLDWLSGGRVICGIGAGHLTQEFEILGADFEHRGGEVGRRVPQLIAALEDEQVAPGFGAAPRPAQHPRPPVWLAGSTPPAIARAAKLADGWLPQGPSDDAMVDLLLRTREQAGRADEPMAIGHITPRVFVGTPSWDVDDGTITGAPQDVAEQVVASGAARANQIQVRFASRGLDEDCEQLAAFGAHVAPLIGEL
jgi:alkanesulfonate monooxygenase SsuD/methylene tetrahydromethanopterin reductase-like flavin-dependent oxidoreductase (luciferase family)